jgi:hypothetical protein
LGNVEWAGGDTIAATTTFATIQSGQAILLKESAGWANGDTSRVEAMVAALIFDHALQIGKDTSRLFGNMDILSACRQFITNFAGGHTRLAANTAP